MVNIWRYHYTTARIGGSNRDTSDHSRYGNNYGQKAGRKTPFVAPDLKGRTGGFYFVSRAQIDVLKARLPVLLSDRKLLAILRGLHCGFQEIILRFRQ
jgi:hypothetical protein